MSAITTTRHKTVMGLERPFHCTVLAGPLMSLHAETGEKEGDKEGDCFQRLNCFERENKIRIPS